MRRMCVGAWGRRSRNATTRSVSWTTSASTSRRAILQNRQSEAVSATMPPNLPQAAVSVQDQAGSHHGGGLRPKDLLAKRGRNRTRVSGKVELVLGETA